MTYPRAASTTTAATATLDPGADAATVDAGVDPILDDAGLTVASAVDATATGAGEYGLPAPIGDELPSLVDFWAHHDEARAVADLLEIPPAAVVAVLGPLDVTVPVARRYLADHPVGDGRVLVLTERDEVPGEPTWITVHRAPDLLAALQEPVASPPLLVLDVPRDLPLGVRPLIARLREHGLGLVRYVLDDEPDDEDLATWHGELGRPSVLDLASPVHPRRVLELLERGEPIASIDGVPVSAELLLALRLEVM